MKDTEKKMKTYISRVKWRLNLPREIKDRAVSELAGSVQTMQEAGKRDEEILAELGTPRQVAAQLNEQWKEYAWRKSPWRFDFLACAVYGALQLFPAFWINVLYWFLSAVYEIRSQFYPLETYSVGIIGGADGPTAIFVAGPVWAAYLPPVAMLVIGIWGYLRLCRCRQK